MVAIMSLNAIVFLNVSAKDQKARKTSYHKGGSS